MGAEKEQTFEAIVEFHILRSSSHPRSYLWYLLGMCFSQRLLYVQDMGKHGRAEHFSVAVICCFPWQRLIFLFPEWIIL